MSPDFVLPAALVALTLVMVIGGFTSLAYESYYRAKKYSAKEANHRAIWSKEIEIIAKHPSCQDCDEAVAIAKERHDRRIQARRS